MAKRYKVLLKFTGSASMDIEADTIEAVRHRIAELELQDIARVGHADILTFEVAAREITPTVLPGAGDDEEADTANRKRPSGWYRPA
jgi:hypothetical protein